MKKTLAIILAMLMCLSVMVSCGGKTEDPAATTTAAQGGENTPADTTTAPAETTESP